MSSKQNETNNESNQDREMRRYIIDNITAMLEEDDDKWQIQVEESSGTMADGDGAPTSEDDGTASSGGESEVTRDVTPEDGSAGPQRRRPGYPARVAPPARDLPRPTFPPIKNAASRPSAFFAKPHKECKFCCKMPSNNNSLSLFSEPTHSLQTTPSTASDASPVPYASPSSYASSATNESTASRASSATYASTLANESSALRAPSASYAPQAYRASPETYSTSMANASPAPRASPATYADAVKPASPETRRPENSSVSPVFVLPTFVECMSYNNFFYLSPNDGEPANQTTAGTSAQPDYNWPNASTSNDWYSPSNYVHPFSAQAADRTRTPNECAEREAFYNNAHYESARTPQLWSPQPGYGRSSSGLPSTQFNLPPRNYDNIWSFTALDHLRAKPNQASDWSCASTGSNSPLKTTQGWPSLPPRSMWPTAPFGNNAAAICASRASYRPPSSFNTSSSCSSNDRLSATVANDAVSTGSFNDFPDSVPPTCNWPSADRSNNWQYLPDHIWSTPQSVSTSSSVSAPCTSNVPTCSASYNLPASSGQGADIDQPTPSVSEDRNIDPVNRCPTTPPPSYVELSESTCQPSGSTVDSSTDHVDLSIPMRDELARCGPNENNAVAQQAIDEFWQSRIVDPPEGMSLAVAEFFNQCKMFPTPFPSLEILTMLMRHDAIDESSDDSHTSTSTFPSDATPTFSTASQSTFAEIFSTTTVDSSTHSSEDDGEEEGEDSPDKEPTGDC